jgi:hypothetical protein
MGQFGIELEVASPDKVIRQLRLPMNDPSILVEALERRETLVRPLAETTANNHLVEALGGQRPSEALAAPLIVNDQALLVLYGDNLHSDEPIGAVAELDLLMSQAGLAMEKRLLERRIERLEVSSPTGKSPAGG